MTILCEKKCHLDSFDDKEVRIAIGDLKVYFPISMFSAESLRFGQNFMYQIKMAGLIKYEHFEPVKVETSPENRKKIEDIVGQIK